jgi:fibronectin-binding autotransporter adhesin
LTSQPSDNNIVGLNLGSMTFLNSTFNAPLSLGGNAITLTSATAAGASITRLGTLATASLTGHGYVNGQVVTIAGAGTANVNGTYAINVIDANTFTYTSVGSGDIQVAETASSRLATINNLNTTAARTVTIANHISVANDQVWARVATDGTPITILSGNLSGSGNVTIFGKVDSLGTALPVTRLTGTNSGYTGTINFSDAGQFGVSQGVLLGSSASMSGGMIDISGNNQNLWLTGGAGSGTYTFGIDGSTATGARVKFGGSSDAGLYMTGGDVAWNIGGTTDYTWNAAGAAIVRLQGGNETIPYFHKLGTAAGMLIISGADKTLASTSGNNPGRVQMLYGLTDDAAGQRTLSSSLGLLVLTKAAVNDANPLRLTISGGATAISEAAQVPGGNLSIGGVLILDNVAGNFRAFGTADGQMQLSGSGGFAARAANVSINSGNNGTFNRDITLGAIAMDTATTLYANKAVNVTQDTVLNGTRTWIVQGSLVNTASNGLNTPGQNWKNFNPSHLAVHEFSGAITGGQTLNINSVQSQGAGILRLSNTGNAISGIVLGATGRMVLIAPDVAALGGATVTLRANSNNAVGALLLWENTGVSPKTFAKDLTLQAQSSAGEGGNMGVGSYAGQAVHTGTLNLTGGGGNGTSVGAGNQHQFLAQSGSTYQAGVAAGTALTMNYTRTAGTGITYVKGGSGTMILANMAYTTPPTTTYWQIGTGVQNNQDNTVAAPYFDGAVRETGTGASNSLNGYNITLAGGVLESNGSFTRALGTTSADVRWLKGGGGFAAHGGALNVNIGGASALMTWNTSNFVTTNNPLIFGSETANNTVTFENAVNLNNAIREIRVMDNAGSAADKAIISGNLTGTGLSGLVKTGGGILELTGAANNYTGTTAVNAGILRVNGNLTGLGAVTVAGGATLGGSGGIAGAVTLLTGGMIAPGNSIESLGTGSQAWNGGALFELEIKTQGSGTSGTDWDKLEITGSLDMSAVSSGNPYVIHLVTRNAGDTANAAMGTWNANVDHTWASFVTTTTGITGYAADKFSVNTSLFQNTINGSFSVAQNGNSLDLKYIAIPEPGTLLLLGLGFSVMFVWGRRKR